MSFELRLDNCKMVKPDRENKCSVDMEMNIKEFFGDIWNNSGVDLTSFISKQDFKVEILQEEKEEKDLKGNYLNILDGFIQTLGETGKI